MNATKEQLNNLDQSKKFVLWDKHVHNNSWYESHKDLSRGKGNARFSLNNKQTNDI